MTHQMKRYVVAVDDYGIRETDKPIVDLARAGKVDRVAVLIRYASDEELQMLRGLPIALDIHLEIIDLLGRGDMESDSFLKRIGNFLANMISGNLRSERIEATWRAQIELFRDRFGRLPDGLNSHEHVHYFPPFFRIFLRLAKEYGIRRVRFGKKGVLLGTKPTMAGRILRLLWKFDRKIFEKEGGVVETSEYVVSLDWIRDVGSFSKTLPGGSIELVSHPERPEEYAVLERFF